VIGEEFGLLMCAVVVVLYCAIVARVLLRLVDEEDLFTVLAGTGLVAQSAGRPSSTSGQPAAVPVEGDDAAADQLWRFFHHRFVLGVGFARDHAAQYLTHDPFQSEGALGAGSAAHLSRPPPPIRPRPTTPSEPRDMVSRHLCWPRAAPRPSDPRLRSGGGTARRGHHVALITDARGAAIPGKPDFLTAHVLPAGRLQGKNPINWIKGLRRSGRPPHGAAPVESFQPARDRLWRLSGASALLAASSAGIPSLIHEQNAVLGRVNRYLAGRVDAIATAYHADRPARRQICRQGPPGRQSGARRCCACATSRSRISPRTACCACW
jgi:hypothetical protein